MFMWHRKTFLGTALNISEGLGVSGTKKKSKPDVVSPLLKES